MHHQLLNIEQQQAYEAIVIHQNILNQYNQAYNKRYSGLLKNGFVSAISNGNLADVMNLFSTCAKQQSITNNPVVDVM
jgi:hypothetical protein